ncbi:MAG: pyridoxamine 5'-phosphate oxidase family protein [Patescibacteria group bacterium]
MPDLKQLLKKYLASTNVMQLATSVDGRPWACTVHFYADDNFNLYWISTEARRHSQEIHLNSRTKRNLR